MKLYVGLFLLAGCAVDDLATTSTAADDLLGINLGSMVTQNVLPGLANATDRGAAAGSTPMRLVISLARPNPAGELARIEAEHTPGNALYGQFMTPAAFAAEFGVPAAQANAVTAWLAGGGLGVQRVSAARDAITATGTVAQIDALLGTATHEFGYAGGAFVANTRAPVVPYSLHVANIVGLNTLQRMALPADLPAQGTCLGGTCLGLTTPQDLWTAYGQTGVPAGTGQRVAIFGEGQTDGVIADLRQFETANGLPAVPVTVEHPAGQTDFSDDSGHEEWNIDTQASTGMAPDVDGLTLYFATDLSDASVIDLATMWTDEAGGPLQASASFGECETVPVVSALVGALGVASLPVSLGLGNNMDATLTPILQQAAAEGKTLFASTGDTGSSCPIIALPIIGAGNGLVNQIVPITNSPASLPWVTAVGGTVLYTDGSGNRVREYGWAFSGGGTTLFTAAPAYQTGTQGLLPCVTDPLETCRGIPDVSAQSGDVLTNGYAIVSSGAASTGAGTSLSSPLWLGMWARIQTGAAGGLGFANFYLYAKGNNAATYANDFFDVSSIDTSHGLPATNGLYVTTPGWDYVTGFGTPNVLGLWCGAPGNPSGSCSGAH